MTAPGSPGTYTSRWQLRVAGNHIGPVVEIPVEVRSQLHALACQAGFVAHLPST
jgi:hypothetical protein